VSRDIVVIGASAGGLGALRELARGLPHDLPAALFVVLHTSAESPGFFATLLRNAGPLSVAFASHGQPIEHGHIYVAPADRHLLVKGETMALTRGPRENGFRPAADPLFRSAAESHGGRVVGIVLSGALSDGTRGLQAIKQAGGIAIAQDPDDATVYGMPSSAIRTVDVDYVLPAREMPAVIARLATGPPANGDEAMMRRAGRHRDPAERGDFALRNGSPGTASPYTCPQCGGALWESETGKITTFGCHIGHAFTVDGLMAKLEDGVEAALWSAVRALEEKAALRRRVAEHARRGRFKRVADRCEMEADEAERQANVVRAILTESNGRSAATGRRSAGRNTARRGRTNGAHRARLNTASR
jgi:two-component system chemotaxis response regulator CheB